MSERIGIDLLQPGMVIVSVTKQNGPVRIKKAGLVSSHAMIQGLKEMGVIEVEIDPEQTVEIEHATPHKTTTQSLIRGRYDTSEGMSDTLGEQFNRNVFLPTVQALPSVWKVYAKQAINYLVIAGAGLAVGFLAATPELWWLQDERVIAQPSQVKDTPEAEIDSVAASDGMTPRIDEASNQPSLESDKGGSITETVSSPVSKRDITRGTNTGQEVAQTPVNEDVDGKVLNAAPKNEPAVSPELVARFNQAIEALDNEVRDDIAQDEVPVTVHNDLPRVDQLPVKLLTRLPSMNFSAHMYASQSRDRWVRVNGVQLAEGDWIDEKVQVVSIEAQQVVLGFEGELFTMAALTDW